MGDDYELEACGCGHPGARAPCSWCASEDRVEEEFSAGRALSTEELENIRADRELRVVERTFGACEF